MNETTDDKKYDAVVDLIARAGDAVNKLATDLRESRVRSTERAFGILEKLVDLLDEHAPDPEWWRDFFLMSGHHVILTEEGWEPGDAYEGALATDRPEILDELNRPEANP